MHIQAIMYNTICAVNWIHKVGVLHRDIKPSNILIDEDCKIRLCDFGLARSFSGLATTPTKYFDDVKHMVSEENKKRNDNG